MAHFNAYGKELEQRDPLAYKRAKHIVTENARVLSS